MILMEKKKLSCYIKSKSCCTSFFRASERKLSKRIKSLDLNIKSINFKISWYFFIKKYKQNIKL